MKAAEEHAKKLESYQKHMKNGWESYDPKKPHESAEKAEADFKEKEEEKKAKKEANYYCDNYL